MAFLGQFRYNSIIMTYIYRVLRDGPSGVWSLDSLPLNDSSGYGRNATYTGSPVTTLPIVAGGVAAIHLEAGDAISYPVENLMISGREGRSFSLEAWIKPSGGNDSIIARESSGLFLDGHKLRFSVDVHSVEYPGLKPGNVYHVVAVYDTVGIHLYVNGEAVASADIEPVVFTDSAPNLITDTTTQLVVDSVAVYPFALNNGQVVLHYEMGTDYPEVINLSTLNGGTYYEFTDQNVETYRKTAFPEVSWARGLFSEGLVDVDNSVVNLYSETDLQYQAGTWEYQESFEVDPDVTIQSSRILWSATDDILVEMSEDGGSTWTTLTNGGRIAGTKSLTSGYSVTIRVSIPASVEQIVLHSLIITFYSSMDVRGSDEDLPAIVRNPAGATVAESSFPAASFNDNAGINLTGASGGLSIAGDTEFGGYFAVEMTVKLPDNAASATVLWVDTASAQPQIVTDGTGQWTFSNLSGLYVDGVAVTSPAAISPGVWHHVIATFPESLATVYVGNDVVGASAHSMRIGHLATYSDPVSASDASAIYKAWTGAPTIQVKDNSKLAIFETDRISKSLASKTISLATAPYGYPVAVSPFEIYDDRGFGTLVSVGISHSTTMVFGTAPSFDGEVVYRLISDPETTVRRAPWQEYTGNTHRGTYHRISPATNGTVTATTSVTSGLKTDIPHPLTRVIILGLQLWATGGPNDTFATTTNWSLPQNGGSYPWLGTTKPANGLFYIGKKIATGPVVNGYDPEPFAFINPLRAYSHDWAIVSGG